MSFFIQLAIFQARLLVRIGDTEQALRIYETILKKSPNNEKAQQALTRLRTIHGATNVPQDKINELLNLYNQGLLNEVIDSAEILLSHHPESVQLLNILGSANAAFNRLDIAAHYFEQALNCDPNYVEAHFNLGNVYTDKDDLDKAMTSYRRALVLNPNFVEAHYQLGNALVTRGNLDEAINHFESALKLKPDFAEAHNNLANALKNKGELVTAITTYKALLSVTPDFAEAHYNLGNALKENGAIDEAISSFEHALKLKPDFAEAHNSLGEARAGQEERNAAIASYRRALEFKPDFAEAHFNLGNVLTETGQLDEAITNYQHALQFNPDIAQAYSNLGTAQTMQGKLDEAVKNYEHALKLRPELMLARAQKLHQQAQMCNWSCWTDFQSIENSLGIKKPSVPTFGLLAMEDNPKRQQQRAENLARETYQREALAPFTQPFTKPEKLRIGYFSADYGNHAMMFLMAGLFEKHDRDRFEIIAYSLGPDRRDDMNARIKASFDSFYEVRTLSDREIAERARLDQIDIAIDLNGYTTNSRPGIFAYRAAPVQINYLGYPGTMGAEFMDYMIVDEVTVPLQSRQYYSEQLIYLPNTYQVNDDKREISAKKMTRSECGLPEYGFIFCCFNNNYKISPREFDIWMRLLGQVQDSVLWLLHSNRWASANLRKEAESRGIKGERIVFADRLPMSEHLARHRLADLFVDTFNYNAHTTASDALWTGLPLITLAGESFAARVAASLLHAIDLPELVTDTEELYETLALELATNSERLENIKFKLMKNRLTTPLFNTEMFARHIEDAYQQAYMKHLDGKRPETIRITA